MAMKLWGLEELLMEKLRLLLGLHSVFLLCGSLSERGGTKFSPIKTTSLP